MKFSPPFVFALVTAPLLFALSSTVLRADSTAPAGTVEQLPASSPYGEATAIRNIAYVANGTPRQTFDLYLPAKHEQPLPFIVWIHGGAWELSSKEWDNVKYLVKNGYAIATIDYRLAPQDKFPAQIQDCNAAMNFVVAHAAAYGLDAKRFVVGGASAGGHLCLLLGMARHQKEFGADSTVRPRAILDFFGPSDLSGAPGDLQAAHSEQGIKLLSRVVPQLLGATVEAEPARARVASPLTYVDPEVVPVLILQGTKDPLVPPAQSERLHTRLDEAKVKNQLILVEGAPHDGPAFSTPERQAEVLSFLRAAMH